MQSAPVELLGNERHAALKAVLRPLGFMVALALIIGSFFDFVIPAKPRPLLKIDTQQANGSLASEGLNFSAQGLDGKRIDLSDYRGHPVIIDFWATSSEPSRRQIPSLVALYNKYNKSRGLVVIGVSYDQIQGDGVKAVAPFVAKFRMTYPIALADQRLAASMGVDTVPTTLFIGTDGKVISRIVGAGHPGQITLSAKQLLDNSNRSTSAVRTSAAQGTKSQHYL
jgi:thiol-disulfide isomerase/thioredoxin